MNQQVLNYLKNLTEDDLKTFLTSELKTNNPDLKDAYEIGNKIRVIFNKEFSKPTNFDDYEKINDEFLTSLLSIEFNEDSKFYDINANTFISAMLAKFNKDSELKQISGKQFKLMHNFMIEFLNQKFCRLASIQICQNVMKYFIDTKINNNISDVILTNPFSAIVLLDYMRIDLLRSYDDYDMNKNSLLKRKELGLSIVQSTEPQDIFNIDNNTLAFSYKDEYARRKADYDSLESADLVFFNRFIADTSLEQICDLSKELNLFDLNDFVSIANTKSDYLTISIQSEKNSKKSILQGDQKEQIEKLENQASKLNEQNKQILIQNEILKEQIDLKKDELDSKELLGLLCKRGKKWISNIIKIAKDK